MLCLSLWQTFAFQSHALRSSSGNVYAAVSDNVLYRFKLRFLSPSALAKIKIGSVLLGRCAILWEGSTESRWSDCDGEDTQWALEQSSWMTEGPIASMRSWQLQWSLVAVHGHILEYMLPSLYATMSIKFTNHFVFIYQPQRPLCAKYKLNTETMQPSFYW